MNDNNKSAARKRRKYFIRLTGSLIILSILFLLLPRDRLLSGIAKVPWYIWASAFVMYLCMHVMGAMKWAIVINSAGARIGIRDAIFCYYSGLFCNLWLPSLVGGDVVRAGLAMSRSDSKAGLVSGSILDRLADVSVLMIIAIGGALFLAPGSAELGIGILWRVAAIFAIFVALGCGLVCAIFVASRMGVLAYKHQRKLVSIRQAIRGMRNRKGQIGLAVGLALILQSSLVLLQAWLAVWCEFEIALALWFFAWPLAKLSSVVPVSLGGLGIRETALVALLLPFGAAAAEVVSVGLVFEVIVFGGGLLAGLVALAARRVEPVGMVEANSA